MALVGVEHETLVFEPDAQTTLTPQVLQMLVNPFYVAWLTRKAVNENVKVVVINEESKTSLVPHVQTFKMVW